MRLKIENWFIKNREGNKLEFKQTFQKKQKEYIRTICAFANNSWWNIIFWVSDNPRKPIWLIGNKYTDFINYDQKDLNNQILNTLSWEIIFKISDFEQNWFKFWYLEVKEAKIKPIICKVTDSNQNLREWLYIIDIVQKIKKYNIMI